MHLSDNEFTNLTATLFNLAATEDIKAHGRDISGEILLLIEQATASRHSLGSQRTATETRTAVPFI